MTRTSAAPQGSFRPVILPGMLLAAALVVGLTTQHLGTATFMRYLICVLAGIVAVMAFQAKSWWWLPPIAAIVVLWNPVYPFAFGGTVWDGAHVVAAAVALAAGIFVRQQNPPVRTGR